MTLNDRLAALLRENGAVAFGCARAEPVDDSEWKLFQQWIDRGFHAGMAYMENYPEIRKDPRKLLDGARTIISIAFNYRQPNPIRGLATYALGKDYHKVLRKRLKTAVKSIENEFGGRWRICIDSAPVLERYWAEKCGVGYRSPVHGNIVVPGTGSMVFLAELITTLEIDGLESGNTQAPKTNESDEAAATVRAQCPTGALQPGGIVDSGRCINYLTIEKKEELTIPERRLIGNALFGCDICQRTCPENMAGEPEVIPEFLPMTGLKEFLKGEKVEFDLKNSPLARSKKFVRK